MRITEELLRKRSEHNDGVLPDLEEISLHQQELEAIELLEQCCRHLKILYLQNNIIGKLENVSKLKELEYLNLALNNIERIEGLEGCESLNKLDLTVNFVDVEDLASSVYNLKANVMLEDLYLMGNPCLDWSGARDYIIASLPQIKQFDSKLVMKAERIQARQILPKLSAELEELAVASMQRKAAERASGFKPAEGAYTIESRIEMYKELEEQKLVKERQEKKRMGLEDKAPRVLPSVLNSRGEIRQCNEGKYDFAFDEDEAGQWLALELNVPKHLDTAQLDVDVNPNYVRCVVKGKVTQLKLMEEVVVSKATVQRSKTTGRLRIQMPIAAPTDRSWLRALKEKAEEKARDLKPLEPAPAKPPKAVSLSICKKDEIGLKATTVRNAHPEPFVDDPSVPPLERVS